MRKRYNRNIFLNLLWHLVRTPENVVEFFFLIGLGVTLMQVFVGYAGYVSFGVNLIAFSGMMVAMSAMSALLVFLRKEPFHFYWESLLPFPIYAYLWFHHLVIAPFSWESVLQVVVATQAYALFLIVLNNSRRRGVRSRLLMLIFAIYFLVVLAGFLQFYLYPDWSPYAGRLRSDQYGYGAGGFLAEPENLAAFVLLFWPLSIMVAWLPRFPGPVRILAGLLVFFGFIAYLMGTHLMGLVVLALVLLVLPFFLTDQRLARRRFYIYGVIGVILSIPLFWYGTDAMQERMEYFWNYPVDELGDLSRQIGYSMFLYNPFFGAGLGSFESLWQSYVPIVVSGSSEYAVSAYAQVLGELGIVGFLLILFPLALILVRAHRQWNRILMYKVDPDIEVRLKRLRSRRKEKLRRKMRKGRVPAPKLILGGLLIGFIAFGLYAVMDYSIKLAGVFFLFVMLLAVIVTFTSEGIRFSHRHRLNLFFAVLPLGLSLWAFSFGVERLQSQNIVFEARERLEIAVQDPNRLFADPAVVYEIESMLENAVEQFPQHGEGWALLGEAHLSRLYLDLFPSEEIGEMALVPLKRALQLAPENWKAQYNYARALSLADGSIDEILQSLRAAVVAAPFRVEPKALLGAILLIGHGSEDDALQFLEDAREIDPAYPPLVAVLNRISMSGGVVRQGGVLDKRLLAEQFALILTNPRRIESAGRLDPEFSGGILPRVFL